jgi:hypothetical protein
LHARALSHNFKFLLFIFIKVGLLTPASCWSSCCRACPRALPAAGERRRSGD